MNRRRSENRHFGSRQYLSLLSDIWVQDLQLPAIRLKNSRSGSNEIQVKEKPCRILSTFVRKLTLGGLNGYSAGKRISKRKTPPSYAVPSCKGKIRFKYILKHPACNRPYNRSTYDSFPFVQIIGFRPCVSLKYRIGLQILQLFAQFVLRHRPISTEFLNFSGAPGLSRSESNARVYVLLNQAQNNGMMISRYEFACFKLAHPNLTRNSRAGFAGFFLNLAMMKISIQRRREAINNFIQYLAGCAVVTFVLRITACSYLDNQGSAVRVVQESPFISNESLALTETLSPAIAIETSRRTEPIVPTTLPSELPLTPICKNNINLDLIFPEKNRLWIQIGTWLNPVEPPADVGMIAFEPEISTVSKLAENRKENIFIIPAAVSDKSGVAIFGGGMNGGQSSSLNVSTDISLSSCEKYRNSLTVLRPSSDRRGAFSRL